MLQHAILSRRDRDCAEVFRFALRFRPSAAFRIGAVEPANPFPANLVRAGPLREKPAGGDQKNVCNRAFRRARTFQMTGSARDFAGCETEVDRLLPLLFRANSKARAKPPRPGLV